MIQVWTDDRVVWLPSSLSRRGMIDMETKDFLKEGWIPKKKLFAPCEYCNSKHMNVLTFHHFAKEMEGSSRQFVTRPWYQKILILLMMRPFQCSTIQGAQNFVSVTLEDKSKLVKGGFYQDGKMNEEIMICHQEVDTTLWNLSMELITQK
ncbi:hypothetical protein ACHAW6_008204 [Cyclotella cf. meneghiniana]